jgi:hypothetical protein
MKRNLLIITAVSAFLALVLWISGLSVHFYRFNRYIINILIDRIASLF